MPSLDLPTSSPRRATPRRAAFLAIALSLLGVVPRAAGAQIGLNLTHTEDASPVPQGMMRVRITTGWTRFDERFIPGGREPLGAQFSSDAFGTQQLPGLIPVEQGLKSLANDPTVRLSLGQLDARSDSRVVVTPIALEFGVTRRLSIGLLVPIVQTRQAIQLRVNQGADTTRRGNVGFVPVGSRIAAASQNAAVYGAFKAAADSLNKLLMQCPSSPTASGCAAVLANTADAALARQRAQDFADGVIKALGSDSASTVLAPRAQSSLANAIDVKRTEVNALIQKYLGAGAGSTSGIFTTPTYLTYIDLQGRDGTPGLLQSALGGGLDSIRTVNRLGTGDISVGAQYLLMDRFQRDTLPLRGVQSRLMVGGSVRFATSILDSSRAIVGYETGDGAGVEVKSALDVVKGKLGGTVAARFIKSFARTVPVALIDFPGVTFPQAIVGSTSRTAGSIMGLDITPRYLPDEYFAIDGHYGVERIGATLYDFGPSGPMCTGCEFLSAYLPNTAARLTQRIGLGFRYSTVEAYLRGRSSFPVEVSYTHLETITGDPGLPKLTRDQVQLRLFFRMLGGK
jgi:hypothetical protein